MYKIIDQAYRDHYLPNITVLKSLEAANRNYSSCTGTSTANFTTFRNFSLFVEYPFAQVQSQDMIYTNISRIEYIQKNITNILYGCTINQW